MNARIPQLAIFGMGAVALGAVALSSERTRFGYLLAGAFGVGAALVWNSYVEERLIASVVAAGQNYPAPPSEVEQGAR